MPGRNVATRASTSEIPAARRPDHAGGNEGSYMPPQGAEAESCAPRLTERERTVLRLLVDGKRNLEISQELDITVRTVKFHVNGLFQKLGVSSRTQVVSHALRQGLLDS